ncbi:hypothetical protein PsorP6_015203 [Peronosclerospora sorghi]|uniref:Uncharacterized protein n=1 Tax=Peronosclerospora sorghi TaxID=230839 RepID=A0ACC0VU86_9STRA|nr:hypothetical protein PsorP6_015203 [Peronosclerospora sorghi]
MRQGGRVGSQLECSVYVIASESDPRMQTLLFPHNRSSSELPDVFRCSSVEIVDLEDDIENAEQFKSDCQLSMGTNEAPINIKLVLTSARDTSVHAAGRKYAPEVDVTETQLYVKDDSTTPPSPTAAGDNVDRQPCLVDVEVDSNAPPTETAADANVDRPLRLVDVIRKASALRHATAASTAAHTSLETPKPLASDVEAIEALYSKGTPYITPGSLLTPPSSPPRRITPPPADTAIVVRRKNKLTQNSDDFANLTSKERPKDTTGITTSNYFSVLSKIEAAFDLVEAPLGVEAKTSFQIKPTIALVPDAVKKSTDASHFLTKHHTKVVKTTQTIKLAETAESMIGDTADVELDLLPDRLVMVATRIPSAHKALNSATNPDRVVQVARQSPLSMNNAILEQMRSDDYDF